MYEIFEKLLKEHNVTTYKVSKETGIAYSTFSDWKAGRSVPKADKLQKIADYFNMSVDQLMGRDKKANRNNDYLDFIKDLFIMDHTDSIKLVSEECKSIRINRDLTEKYVSSQTNVPLKDYLDFENGKNIDADEAIRIISFLEINPAYLYGLVMGNQYSNSKSISEILNKIPLKESTKEFALFLSNQDSNVIGNLLTDTLSDHELNQLIRISEYARKLRNLQDRR